MRKKNVNGYSQPTLNKYSLLKQDSYFNDNDFENSKVAPITHLPSLEARLSRNQLAMQGSAGKLPYYSQNLDRKQRLGEEINKMEDWMTEVYNKRRQDRNFKKSDNLNVSSVSISNDSAILKLPLINTPPSSSEQSKLVQQIRRVENRIKELKFQRSLASTQQQKYEMIRPFMELQSQNMMNMQYMMMMAQQNNSQNHHCCPRNNSNEEPKVMYLPFPQNNQYPQQYQQFPPSNQYQPEQPANSAASKKNTSKKTYNFKKIRKFRVAVIAVSFLLLFPRYANRFTKRRFQLHSQKYFSQDHHYNTLIDLATQHFSEINYYQIAKEVESTRKEKEIRRVTKSKTAKLIISEEYGDVKNYEIYLGDLEVFLLILLKQIQKMMEDGGLDVLLKEISVGNLPFSFPLDHYYLEEEMFRLKLHPQKLYLQIEQIQSKALLMICFFVKLLVYDFLFVIREDLEWKHRLLKQNNLKKNQMIEAEMVATQMYISGILLHRYCMDILRGGLKETEGNLDKLNLQSIPVPMGMMIYQSKDEVDNDKNLSKSEGKRPNRASKEEKQAEEIVDFKLYEFKYIKKLSEFESLMSEIIQKSGHQQQVKEKISDLVDQIHKRAVESRRLQYKEITSSFLSDQKRILTNRIGLEKSQFQMPKRNSSDSIEIKQFLKQMKEEKGKEEEEVAQPAKKKSQKAVKSVKYVDTKTKTK